jgi:hypothetical protein
MDLRLADDEADVLRRSLTASLFDLRMEIGGTDSYDLRVRLKADEAAMRAILDKLGVVLD